MKLKIDQREETWEYCPDVHCPKCGKTKAWCNTSYDHYEDNAGEYYICLNCNHDWHMYPLEGYNSIEFVEERKNLLIQKSE